MSDSESPMTRASDIRSTPLGGPGEVLMGGTSAGSEAAGGAVGSRTVAGAATEGPSGIGSAKEKDSGMLPCSVSVMVWPSAPCDAPSASLFLSMTNTSLPLAGLSADLPCGAAAALSAYVLSYETMMPGWPTSSSGENLTACDDEMRSVGRRWCWASAAASSPDSW